MQVRKFLLENEKGQQINMNNLKEGCFLTSPSNLGYSNESEFQQIGNTFIENNRKISKKDPSGTVYFKSYDKCKEFIDFIEKSDKLKFIYIIPFQNENKTYYRDVSIKEYNKTEKRAGLLACPIIFNGLSLWYEENTIVYKVTPQDNEIRWDFQWDSKFADYDTRSLTYINKGHVEAPVLISIDGHIINPSISLYVEGELVQKVDFKVEINEYEKFLYGTKENDFYVERQKTDGTHESLFSLDVLPDFQTVDEVIRLPKNKNCEIKLTANNEILNAQITILPQYKAV